MAHSPSDAMLAAPFALLVCALLVLLERARPATSLRAILTRALLMAGGAPFVAVGVVVVSLLQTGTGHVVWAVVIAAIFIAIVVRDLSIFFRMRREARSAREATAPTAPLGEDVRGVDFGVGDDLVAFEKAAADPYREAARVRRFFYGSPRRALGSMARAWVLEMLATVMIVGAAVIASRPRPIPATITETRASVPVPLEPRIVSVWSTPFEGNARFAGGDPLHANVELSNGTSASWSLETIDVERQTSFRWSASSANAPVWSALHTRAGLHAVDTDLVHDVERYAGLVGHDSRVAMSDQAIIFANRDDDDTPTRLFMMKRDGSAPSRLDEAHTGSDSPELSRDRTRLAWIAWTDRVASKGYHLVSSKPDGTAQRTTAVSADAFGWRSDGHLIGHVKEHERECIVDADDTRGLHHCIRDARLGSLIWDARGESVAWLGFVGGKLVYEWIRLATGEVLAHGSILGATSFVDALLDEEQPALFVTSGRADAFAMERIDLLGGTTTPIISTFLPAASGRGVMAWGPARSVLFLESDAHRRVQLQRVRSN